MANKSYEQALADYREAYENLYRPAIGKPIERGKELQIEALSSRGELAVNASRRMGDVLSDATSSDDIDVRDLAGLKLLASAATDLALARELIETGGEAAEAERSGSVALNDPELRAVLEAPLDGSFNWALITERAALPTVPDQARIALQEEVKDALKEIPNQAADLSIRAVTGAANFGLGPVQPILSGALDEILKHLPDVVSSVLRTAARLIAEAVRKLWAAFGKEAQEEVQKEAEGWWKKVWKDGSLVSGLLLDLYQVQAINDELATLIAKVPSGSNFNEANRKCEELVGRYAKIKSVLEWVLRALGWLKTPLLAAVPWGPVVAYTIYVAVLGYSVYSGGDYVDAERFQAAWLDHVVGVRTIVERALS